MLKTTWNSGFVVVSYCVSTVGAWTSLVLVDQAIYFRKQKREREFQLFIILGAISLGYSGIWSMHYIGMQALQIDGVTFSFDVGVTLLSLVFSIIFPSLGYTLAASKSPPHRMAVIQLKDILTVLIRGLSWQLMLGGLITGLGVATMHYIGMFSMKMNAAVSWNPGIVVASILIAVTVATVGLLLVFHLNTPFFRLVAAFVMAGAVCGMHYTGMAAARYYPTPNVMSYWSFGGNIAGSDFVPVVITSLLISLIFVNTTYNNMQILAREAELSRSVFAQFKVQILKTLKELKKSRDEGRKYRMELDCIAYARPTQRKYFTDIVKILQKELQADAPRVRLADQDYSQLLKMEEENQPLFIEKEPSKSRKVESAVESTIEISARFPASPSKPNLGDFGGLPASPSKPNLQDFDTKRPVEYIPLSQVSLDVSNKEKLPPRSRRQSLVENDKPRSRRPSTADNDKPMSRRESYVELVNDGDTPSLEDIISHPACLEILRDTLVKTHNEELLACILDLRFYRTHLFGGEEKKSREMQRIWAQRLFETYIQKGAAHQVNLSHRLVTQISQNVTNPSSFLFAECEQEVMGLCADNVWVAFSNSQSYDICRWILLKSKPQNPSATQISSLPLTQSTSTKPKLLPFDSATNTTTTTTITTTTTSDPQATISITTTPPPNPFAPTDTLTEREAGSPSPPPSTSQPALMSNTTSSRSSSISSRRNSGPGPMRETNTANWNTDQLQMLRENVDEVELV
jgi:NO-binding membrane sensor protein with MHYT domain